MIDQPRFGEIEELSFKVKFLESQLRQAENKIREQTDIINETAHMSLEKDLISKKLE